MTLTANIINPDGSAVAGTTLTISCKTIEKIVKESVKVFATTTGGIRVPIGREPPTVNIEFTLHDTTNYNTWKLWLAGAILHVTASTYLQFDAGGSTTATGATGDECAIYIISSPSDKQKGGNQTNHYECSVGLLRYPNWKKA